jgi:hypothetical protein
VSDHAARFRRDGPIVDQRSMVRHRRHRTLRTETCDRCKNASPISYRVESEAAWKAGCRTDGAGCATDAAKAKCEPSTPGSARRVKQVDQLAEPGDRHG